ncbi:MAG: hypothetical protein ABI127_01345 [Dokdonella sp.]
MNFTRLIDLLKRNGADLVTLFIIPILIALMPWKIGFRVLRKLARHEKSHKVHVDQSWQMARLYLSDEVEADWKWRFRTLRLIDRVDAWLALLRPRSWWSKQIIQSGEFPEADSPHVFLSYHWGGGSWIWSQLVRAGFPTHLISRRVEVADLGAGRLALMLAWVRLRGLRRLGGEEVIFLGGASGPVRQVLAAGHSVLGMQDMPPKPWDPVLRRPLLKGEVAYPFGLARLALEANVPVALLSFAFDMNTGKRSLNIITVPRGANLETIATRYIEHLDECLREDSAFWQIWSLAPQMFVPIEPPKRT